MDQVKTATFEGPVATGPLFGYLNFMILGGFRVRDDELFIPQTLFAISCITAVVSFPVCRKMNFASFPSSHIDDVHGVNMKISGITHHQVLL